jgi:tetraacyldisaccharide 4'-kinase
VIAAIREWFYQGRLLKSVELPAFTISVGNLSMGGTGKSPFVMLLARLSLAEGKRTAVITRGYKRKSSNLELVAAGAKLPPVGALGDEPWMIKKRLPGIALLVHRDRARMALRHWKDLGTPELLILDDGFQHWQAVRDRDVLMVDVSESLDQLTIPFGRMRESTAAVGRADMIVLTRAKAIAPEKLAKIEKRLRALMDVRRQPLWKRSRTSKLRILKADYEFKEFFDGATGLACALPEGQEFVLASGIAKPDGVRALARSLNVPVREEIYFSDHHRLSGAEITRLRKAVAQLPGGALLVTEKDWARWRDTLAGIPMIGMRVEFQFLGDGEAQVKEFLLEAPCFT